MPGTGTSVGVREGFRGRLAIEVGILRELFRHLHHFRALYESEGVEELCSPDGLVINLWDLERLYETLSQLPKRQHQAIELCLVQNYREWEAAEIMGVSRSNPVSMYATSGLQRLVEMIDRGELPPPGWGEEVA